MDFNMFKVKVLYMYYVTASYLFRDVIPMEMENLIMKNSKP